MFDKNSLEKISKLERELKIPDGFFVELIREKSDWVFVLKTHSLMEAAITYLLIKKIGKPELEKSFAFLELSNNKTGKIAFLRDFKLLETFRNFIKRFSELRNKFVHDVTNVNLLIGDILEDDVELKSGIINSMKSLFQNLYTVEGKKIDAKTFIEEHLKLAIFTVVFQMLEEIYFHTKESYSFAELLNLEK